MAARNFEKWSDEAAFRGRCGGVGERMEELVCRQCQEGVMRGHQDPAGVEGARKRFVN